MKQLPAHDVLTMLARRNMLMYPIFITDEPDAEVEIVSLPGQKRFVILWVLQASSYS